MNDHLRILQERIQPVAIGSHAVHHAKRIAGKVHQKEKENLDACEHDRGVGSQTLVNFVAQPHNESVRRQQQGPEKQGTLLS